MEDQYYGEQPAPPEKSRKKLYAGIAILATIVVTAIVLIVLFAKDDETNPSTISPPNSDPNTNSDPNSTTIPPPDPVELVQWSPPSLYFGTAQGAWSGEPFRLECNQGRDDYVDGIQIYTVPVEMRISGHDGEEMARIGVKCKSDDINDYEYIGPIPPSPSRNYEFEDDEGFDTFEGRAGWGVVGMDVGHGSISGTVPLDPAQGGYPWEFKCDTPIRGIHGRVGGGDRLDPYDARIGQIGFICQ